MKKYIRNFLIFLLATVVAFAQEDIPPWKPLPPDVAYNGMSMREFSIRTGIKNALNIANRYRRTKPAIMRITKKTADVEQSVRDIIKPYTSFETKKEAKIKFKFELDPIKLQSNVKLYNDYLTLYGYADYYTIKTGITTGTFNLEYIPQHNTVMTGYATTW